MGKSRRGKNKDDQSNDVNTTLSENVSGLQLNEINVQKRMHVDIDLEESCSKKVKRKSESKVEECNGEEDESEDESSDVVFTSSIISDMWELIEIRKLLSDQFLNAQRKVYYTSRVPELNENIIKLLLKQINSKGIDEIAILKKLYESSQDSSYNEDQQDEFASLISVFLEKICNGASEESLDKITELSFITEKKKYELLKKYKKSEVKPSLNDLDNFLITDTLRLLNLIRKLTENAFFNEVKMKQMMDKIRKFREAQSRELPLAPDVVYGQDELHNVSIFVRDPRVSEAARMKIHEKINDVRKNSMNAIKNSKTKLQDKLMKSDDLILFRGTNLEFVEGYGILEPPYVRCINIWRHKKEKKCRIFI